jgi:GTP1/Obg family GTP-binding protein
MNKLLKVALSPAVFISTISLLMNSKVTQASETLTLTSKDSSTTNTKSVSKSEQKACVKHPNMAKYVCASAKDLAKVRKGLPQINKLEPSQAELLNVTDEESDAAVALFGCDCANSINCLRRLRNSLP